MSIDFASFKSEPIQLTHETTMKQLSEPIPLHCFGRFTAKCSRILAEFSIYPSLGTISAGSKCKLRVAGEVQSKTQNCDWNIIPAQNVEF